MDRRSPACLVNGDFDVEKEAPPPGVYCVTFPWELYPLFIPRFRKPGITASQFAHRFAPLTRQKWGIGQGSRGRWKNVSVVEHTALGFFVVPSNWVFLLLIQSN